MPKSIRGARCVQGDGWRIKGWKHQNTLEFDKEWGVTSRDEGSGGNRKDPDRNKFGRSYEIYARITRGPRILLIWPKWIPDWLFEREGIEKSNRADKSGKVYIRWNRFLP